MDSVSDTTLQCGAELVVHAYRDGRAPGLDRLESLSVEGVVFPATGTSEDIAMLLADSKGASLIVAVGSHATLVEFLDKGRSGMSLLWVPLDEAVRAVLDGRIVDAMAASSLLAVRHVLTG